MPTIEVDCGFERKSHSYTHARTGKTKSYKDSKSWASMMGRNSYHMLRAIVIDLFPGRDKFPDTATITGIGFMNTKLKGGFYIRDAIIIDKLAVRWLITRGLLNFESYPHPPYNYTISWDKVKNLLEDE